MPPRNRGYTSAARAQEEELAALFGATRVSGSGSGLHYKDDGTTGSDLDALVPVRFEAKGTNSGTFSLDPLLYVGLRERAVDRSQLPFVEIRFRRGTPAQSDWVLIEDLFLSPEERGSIPKPEVGESRRGSVLLKLADLDEAEHRKVTPGFRWDLTRKLRLGGAALMIEEQLCLLAVRRETLTRIVNDRHHSASAIRHRAHPG